MSDTSAPAPDCPPPDVGAGLPATAAIPPPLPLALVLQARGLNRSFGRVRAVEGVDLNVFQGEIYGFLGVNGAGKTTTIRMLMGIIAAESGTIALHGETERRTTTRQKQRIGYVSQEQTFYPWMNGAQLGRFVGAFYPTWDAQEFVRLLEVLEVPAERRVSQFSGGMKAKLALALALASRPSLLILDEPTAGLDPVARREFMQIIVAQARQHQRTTFFSSHLIDEVERCADRIGIIHQGRMRYEGALTDLRAQVRVLRLPGDVAWEVPQGSEVWRDERAGPSRTIVLRADAAAWMAIEPPPGGSIGSLSLEEIFIACAGARRVQL